MIKLYLKYEMTAYFVSSKVSKDRSHRASRRWTRLFCLAGNLRRNQV